MTSAPLASFGIFSAIDLKQHGMFPSGHTMHAASFSIVVLAYYPALFWLVVPFAVLVALSRPILGLHYPRDVLAGAALGAAIAGISLSF